jgi:hypothetical protein
MAISSERVKTATYVYCVIRSPEKPSVVGIPEGVPYGSSPGVLPVSRELWVVTSSVRLDVYGIGPLETLLRDLDAVGRVALAHEAVVEHFGRRDDMTVVPMKLFTMFSTPQRAVSDIAARRKSLDSAMKRIEQAEEWGIRVIRRAEPRTDGRIRTGHVSGAAFLAAKKDARANVRSEKIAAVEAAAALFDRLSAVSRDSCQRRESPRLSVPSLVLDAAFLVAKKDLEKFTAAARAGAVACSRVGAQMTMTGPWPAYNFVQLDDESPAEVSEKRSLRSRPTASTRRSSPGRGSGVRKPQARRKR